jgi:hypothetical protein
MPTEGVQELVGVEFLEGCVTWVTSFNVLQLYSGILGHLLQSLLDQPTPTNQVDDFVIWFSFLHHSCRLEMTPPGDHNDWSNITSDYLTLKLVTQ